MESNSGIAGYYRLSVEDADSKIESNSITNQRMLVVRYVAEHGEFSDSKYYEFYDDGYSGSNMERPGIKSLLEKVKKQEVSCIIVKDFSRFSRDYIELGSYMEQIFPFMGIRFISITDNYDSDRYIGKTREIDVGIKNLLADFYCKDVSAKVRCSLSSKKNKGIYCTGLVPFGYCKHPVNKYELLIIPEEADVINTIYNQRILGKSITEICRILNDRSVLTPLEYLNKRKKLNRIELRQKRLYWQNSTVYTILTNESYIGNMVYEKSAQAEVSSKKTIVKPREQWKIYENHHLPIIDRERFEIVQCSFFKIRNKARKAIEHDFKGKIYCGGCKRKIRVSKLAKNKYSFYCSYHSYAADSECYAKRLKGEELAEILLQQIGQQIQELVGIQSVKEQVSIKLNQSIRKSKQQLKGVRAATKMLKASKIKDYEAYHRNELSKEDFVKKKKETDKEVEILWVREKEILKAIQKLSELQNDNSDKYKEILRYIGFDELNREMVEVFVDAIYIYNDRIHIKWKFNNKLVAIT